MTGGSHDPHRCGHDLRSGPEMARQLGIPMISQIINFGEESFREGVDMDHAAFMARLRAGRELPKTAAPYPGDFIEAFEELSRRRREHRLHPSVGRRQRHRALGARPPRSLPGRRHPRHRHAHHRRPAGEHRAGGRPAGESRRERRRGRRHVCRSMMPRVRIYFLVDTLEYPAARRAHRRRGGAGGQHPADQADPHLRRRARATSSRRSGPRSAPWRGCKRSWSWPRRRAAPTPISP